MTRKSCSCKFCSDSHLCAETCSLAYGEPCRVMADDAWEFISEYLTTDEVLSMHEYLQHGSVTTLSHSVLVARMSLAFARRYNLKVNEKDLVTGALMHDLFLYNWHDRDAVKPLHALRHPVYAAENAVEIFGVNDHVAHIIRAHMWPLPPTRMPMTTEAWTVTLMDKWSATKETVEPMVTTVQNYMPRRKKQLA